MKAIFVSNNCRKDIKRPTNQEMNVDWGCGSINKVLQLIDNDCRLGLGRYRQRFATSQEMNVDWDWEIINKGLQLIRKLM